MMSMMHGADAWGMQELFPCSFVRDASGFDVAHVHVENRAGALVAEFFFCILSVIAQQSLPQRAALMGIAMNTQSFVLSWMQGQRKKNLRAPTCAVTFLIRLM
jgi:hypothetical protein